MEDPRIGIYVCWCGTNIAKMVDVEAVAMEVEKMENVAIARNYKYMCSDPGQELIINDIKEHKLDRVVVAACSPRIHEITFRKAIENAGLNPYLFEMANIREQVSWVHTDRESATKKALDLVRGAITRVGYHEPLDKLSVEINPATLIIGGGVAGLSASVQIADAGKKVYLLEKSSSLGGVVVNLDLSYPNLDSVAQYLHPLIDKVQNHQNIEVFLNTTADEVFGYIGNFETKIKMGTDAEKELKFGHVIVATGLKPFDPSRMDNYGYGNHIDVITSLELEAMLKKGAVRTKKGEVPKNIAIIHCVGSRNKNYHEFCSRVCCSTALKFAIQLKAAFPDSSIYDLYADMRTYAKGCEELYTKTSSKDIMFLMFAKDNLPVIKKASQKDKCEMIIEMHEMLSGEDIEIPADMVVLMTAMESHEEAKEVAHAVGISMCGNGFYIEKHPKLDPVATTTDGVFIAGTCQGPRDIKESVSQAEAAAARILAVIEKGRVDIEVTTAKINEEMCCGCQTCVNVCPYSAISYDEEKNVSIVNEVLCKGCGTCASACPTGAIRSCHFTDKQIISQIEGVLSVFKEKSKEKEEVEL